MFGGEEAVAPVGFAIGGFAAEVLDGDVGGQVVIEAAEAVADPGACAGEAIAGEAGVHVHTAGTVGVRAAGHAVDEGYVIGMTGDVRQHGADLFAALAGGMEGPWGLHEVAVFALESDFGGTWEGGAVILFQHGFVVPQVDVRGGAWAEDLQHLLGLWWEVRLVFGRVGHEPGERDTGESGGHLAEELAALEEVHRSKGDYGSRPRWVRAESRCWRVMSAAALGSRFSMAEMMSWCWWMAVAGVTRR